MWYITTQNSKIAREILEANDIIFDISEDDLIYTNYHLTTLELLDDFGIITHSMPAAEFDK